MMWTKQHRRLEFLGGPFDGFQQSLSVQADELPACVGLPLNRASGRMLGLETRHPDDSRIAIYQLKQRASGLVYQFRRLQAAASPVQ